MANFQVYLNTLRQKGYLAYEYNPFHNYQTDVDLALIDNKFLVPRGQAVNIKNGELLTKKKNDWVDKRGNIVPSENCKAFNETKLYAKAGSLIDLDTDKLNFDINHPVNIEVQPSYDGSVNLIINDDKNIPRLINSRFSVREKNTYEIVDRIGENDTNIYNSKTFDKDTSLYFQYEYNPIVGYQRFVKGNLQVGQYCFYFTYCDADDNESDYIAESGLIPVFMGSDRDPNSIDGGIKNQDSFKGIQLRLSNLDKSYNYFKVYYVRYFADYQQNRVYECKKILQKYPINSNIIYLQITGNEQTELIDANILNISRFNPKNILTQAQCKNMLFFGNIVKNTDNYKELTDCALRIVPSIHCKNDFKSMKWDYTSPDGQYAYYNSKNIYDNTGYFDQEYYRFGIVFIYQNGTLSNVYNTLGCELTNNNNLYYKETKDNTTEDNLFTKDINELVLNRNYIEVDDRGWIKNPEKFFSDGISLNARGVCRFNYNITTDDEILGVKFKIPQTVINFLKEDLGIRGFFFVRQKCIPNILAQCYLLPIDEQLEAPVLEFDGEKHATECFVSQGVEIEKDLGLLNIKITEKVGSREVVNSYESRLYQYKHDKSDDPDNAISRNAYAAICPDFLLNQPYYNQIFNGSKFKLQKISDNSELIQNGRIYYENEEPQYISNGEIRQVIINSVTQDIPTVAIKDKVYRTEIGECEEAFRFQYCEVDSGVQDLGDDSVSQDDVNEATNIVRGVYSPYLAIYSDSKLSTSALYNIYADQPAGEVQEYQTRMDSSEPFYAISDRYNFEGLSNNDNTLVCWRGDCYINTFTFRLNRNFNDPSLPNNDEIIDKNTWKDNYNISDQEGWSNISRSDLNAVQMGSWITFKCRSAMNYALRSQDHSYVAEEALMGAPRSYYPRNQVMWRGENKMPDSYLYNDAYRASLGFKCYFALKDINYIKDTFSNRIQYSAISIQDSYKNNYRYSLSTYFRDYSQEYGSIQKLIEIKGDLLVVFEHGIGIATINERILAGGGENDPVFINSKNVLPEELLIITNTYGTQWPDSVIKSESGYVYGVDTITKKIWRVVGQNIDIISDFKVNKFLIDNISLGERETSPIIGLKNVKTHYNNNKKDVIFTFYDDIYKDEEKVWSLCYNELLGDSGQGSFVTFYSWIPSFSENIDTQFFTFNRDTAKDLSLLNISNYAVESNYGILLDTPILDSNNSTNLKYRVKETTRIKNINNSPYKINEITKELTGITFKLEKDHWENYKWFDINNNILKLKNTISKNSILNTLKERNTGVIILQISAVAEDISNYITDTQLLTQLSWPQTIAITFEDIVENPIDINHSTKPSLTTDFYLHGQAGIFDIKENVYPTHWYGKYHPFEFEFIVNDKPGQQKIFENLILISNKAEPESFHFEIEGDNYEFSQDKRTMYFRQEATKNLYQNLGSDMLYDRKYTDVAANEYTYEQYYRGGIQDREGYPSRKYSDYKDYYNVKKGLDKVYPIYQKGLVQQVKSTIFPLYYEKIDTYNDIYYKYTEMVGTGYDFQNLSGSEIKWNRDLNQFNIITHIKNSPIDNVGVLRGNSRYKEGKWNIQIPSIIFNQKNEFDQKNESKWVEIPNDLREDGPLKEKSIKIPPIVVNSSNLPKYLPSTDVSLSKLPNIYQNSQYNWIRSIDNSDWTYRKETKIRDKWIKIRVRYSGKNLAVIHSLITLYNISYS